MKAVLPMKPFVKERAIRIIRYYQKRNYIAYISHRKKKVSELQKLALWCYDPRLIEWLDNIKNFCMQ